MYNQLVAAVMAVDGVYDVVVDLFPQGAPPTGRQNLSPEPNTRPKLGDGACSTSRCAGEALDRARRRGRGRAQGTRRHHRRRDHARRDPHRRREPPQRAAPDARTGHPARLLLGKLTDTDTYAVDQLSYTAEFLDEGLRILSPNKEIEPAADQVPWVRSVAVTDSEQVT